MGCNGTIFLGEYMKLREKKRLETGVHFKMKSAHLKVMLLRYEGRVI
jgi:hypothetical protein